MAKGRQGKGPRRRLRKPGRRASSSAGRGTQTSSTDAGARTFSVNTTKSPDRLVGRARRVASENNATFRGNTTSGSFSGGGVKGTYEIEGRTVKVTVTDKPSLVPWSTVESRIKEFFR